MAEGVLCKRDAGQLLNIIVVRKHINVSHCSPCDIATWQLLVTESARQGHRTPYQQHQGDRCTSDQDEQVEKVGVVKTACTTAGTLTSLHSHIACPILDYARIAESGCTSPHKMWKHSWPTRVVFVY